MYTYGTHFKERMEERLVSIEAIEYLLDPHTDKITIPSSKDSEVDLIMGFYQGKGFAIIVNRHTHKLITVRRLHPKEIKLFEKEFSDDQD